MRYRAHLSTQTGRRALVKDMMRDRKFLERYGARERRNMPVDRFICETFRDILARWPDDGAMKTYTAMAKKRNGRARVQSAILRSTEGRRRGGGRLGRVAGLARFAASGPLLARPILGRLLALRTARRLGLSPCPFWRSIWGTRRGDERDGASFPVGRPYRPVSIAGWNDKEPDPIDPVTASARDINDWTFQRAYADAHRRALVDREPIA